MDNVTQRVSFPRATYILSCSSESGSGKKSFSRVKVMLCLQGSIWDKILSLSRTSTIKPLFPISIKGKVSPDSEPEVPEDRFFPSVYRWVYWVGMSGDEQQQKSEIYSLRSPELAKFTSIPWSAILGHGYQNAVFGPAASTSPRNLS